MNLINKSLNEFKEAKVVNEEVKEEKSIKETNMGYVRMENTARDLDDVLEHINDEDLSSSEFRYRNELIETCKTIVEEAMEMNEPESDDGE